MFTLNGSRRNHFIQHGSYGTDLTQRRTPSRVLGYHSRATRTRSSICIIGLELAVVLALERKMVRAVLKILKMILMALSYIAVLVTRKCTHAAWRFKIEIVTSNSALISFHQHCSRISCCSLVIFFLFIGLS